MSVCLYHQSGVFVQLLTGQLQNGQLHINYINNKIVNCPGKVCTGAFHRFKDSNQILVLYISTLHASNLIIISITF